MIKVALDNKAVKEVQKAIGGGQGGNNNPCELITGRKLIIDLSSEVLEITNSSAELYDRNGTDIAVGVYFDKDFHNDHGDYYANNRVYKAGYDEEAVIRVLLYPNEQNNQLLMQFVGRSGYYMTLSQPIVIYEGDVSDMSDTDSILDSLPTITVTLNEDDFTCLEYMDFEWFGREGAHKVFTSNTLTDVYIHVNIE